MSTFSIHHDQAHDILVVKRTGLFDVLKSIPDLGQVIEALQKANVKRVLVDHREVSLKGSTTDVFEVGDHLFTSEAGLFFYKLAILYAYQKEDPKAEHYRFFEAVLINRGFNARLFLGDTQAAIDWLLE